MGYTTKVASTIYFGDLLTYLLTAMIQTWRIFIG